MQVYEVIIMMIEEEVGWYTYGMKYYNIGLFWKENECLCYVLI